ncbi:TrkH family potassium uptake protein [Sphingobacterium corticibacter]|uniref:ATPase n=1 Tax=Sphingobacterium corticibacter TaxID=2171749 RepID=A0A2T8HH04_9SPHI|nr:potassium transporter TrkG [Sphingobacterium corticibacter]PVH24695.1 ATPase [Sphingobacterium corticibacter]
MVSRQKLYNPAQLFVLSFMLLILAGCILLKMPFALQAELSWVDALFTSTSAVCVTGLAVVDTATYFTRMGQFIIMLLIQAGGIGILSFAGLFSYFLKGGSTYENQLAIGNFSNTDRMSEVFVLLRRTVYITFSIELISGIFIFFSISDQDLHFADQLFIAIFHSVSAFCNAGFSILPSGAATAGYVNNYTFQLLLAATYILGGLGFPIVVNILKYLRHVARRILGKLGKREYFFQPWVININSKINLITTLLASVFATIFIYANEYRNVLSSHDGFGKWVIAFATATTPRTAGFNSVDFAALEFSSIIFIIFLMWIGASPNSTGGGIKTSTLAVAVLNVFSLARGKDRTEVFRREISPVTIQRAFATMFLSLITIGVAIILISFFEPSKPLMDIAFECFSAYSTVGLSLNVTSSFTIGSKIILIITMFIGRVTMLSMLIAVIKKVKHLQYRYASEELTIY